MDVCEIFFSKCCDGNMNEVEIFLSEGISPDVQNAEGETGLQISAANGFLGIVKLLLNNGASVDLTNNYGWTPLMHAARHGHLEIVSFLIEMKAKVNVSNRLGLRPIDVAAWSGNLPCVKLLLEFGAVIDNLSLFGSQTDLCDISPLMAASLQGHDHVLRTLLEKGSAANQASSITGLTPLMLAACNDHKNAIEILIEFGSDVNTTDICCRTALDLAAVCCREDIKTFLEDLTQPVEKKLSGGVPRDINILRIVRTGDIAQIKSLLLQNQSFSNYTDPDDGVTPLMIASMLGFNDVIDLLISSGADLNAQDITNGWTPLMYAVFHRQAATVHLLLDRGVDIDICTSNGYTALDLAIHADSSETDILETLLALSGSEELLDTEYLEPSSSAIRQSHLAVEKASSRNDSQTRFKDLFEGLSSHLRQFSRSSAISPAADADISDEIDYDVFPDDDVKEAPVEGNFLCLSKFYAPDERFAHLVKEQEVEAISLPPFPTHISCAEIMKTIYPKKDKVSKGLSTKPHFNSLRTPNLVKRYMKTNLSASFSNISEKCMLSESVSLDIHDSSNNLSAVSVSELKPKPLQPEDFSFGEKSSKMSESASEGSTLKNVSDFSEDALGEFIKIDSKSPKHESHTAVEVVTGGLTALLNQESLKKYAEKFRDQEIDLETFKYLTEEDLDEIGISSFNSRHKLMEIIDKLKNS